MNSSLDSLRSYFEDGYNQALKCPVCNEIFEYPRILPCGDSVCFGCIVLLKEGDDSEGNANFKCPVCEQVHMNLTSDLPRNNAIENILKLNSTTLYPNKLAQELKSNLKILRKQANRFKYILANPQRDVQNSCEALKKKVVWTTHRKVHVLNESKKSLMEQIDAYEHKCLEKMGSLAMSAAFSESMDSIKSSIETVDEFVMEQAEYLSKSLLDEHEIEEANEKTKSFFMDLCWDMKTVDLYRYDEGKMEFISNEQDIEPKILGILELKPRRISVSRDKAEEVSEGFMQNRLREIDEFMTSSQRQR